jgi:hypothetical protein
MALSNNSAPGMSAIFRRNSEGGKPPQQKEFMMFETWVLIIGMSISLTGYHTASDCQMAASQIWSNGEKPVAYCVPAHQMPGVRSAF